MAEITAGMVKALRESDRPAPMMECKKALTEAGGDMKRAEEILRIKLGDRASKVAARIAAEGVVACLSRGGRIGALVEVNCETDFVAKDANFADFVKAVAAAAANSNAVEVEALLQAAGGDGRTVEAARQGLVMKLGENISVRRFVRLAAATGQVASYVHGRKIGVLVEMNGGDESLGRDIAMHIAASRPECVSREQVSAGAHRQGEGDLHRPGGGEWQAAGNHREDGDRPHQQVSRRDYPARYSRS